MKKIIYVLCLCTAMTMLSGCNSKKENNVNTGTNSNNTQATQAVTQTDKDIKGIPMEGHDYILDISGQFKNDDYYFESASLYSDEYVLVTNRNSDFTKVKLRLYNLYTEKFDKEIECDLASKYYQEVAVTILSDGGLALCADDNCEYVFVDKDFKTATVKKVAETNEYIIKYLSKDGKYVYYEKDNNLMRYDFEKNEIKELIAKSKAKILSIEGISDNGKYMSVMLSTPAGREYGLVNLENMSISRFQSANDSELLTGDNLFMYYSYNREDNNVYILNPETPRTHKTFMTDKKDDDGAYISHFVDEDTLVISKESINESVFTYIWYYYDIKQGKLMHKLSFESDTMFTTYDIKRSSDGKYLFVMRKCFDDIPGKDGFITDTKIKEKSKYYVIKLDKVPVVEEKEISLNIAFNKNKGIVANAHPTTDPLYVCYQRAYEISKKYGVNVFVGEDGAKSVSAYEVKTCMDKSIINAALDSIEKQLARYPKAILSNLKTRDGDGLDICLSGAISGRTSNALESVNGFAASAKNRNMIVIDARYGNLQSILSHEVSHIIDKRISMAEIFLERDFEEEWNSLNPKGFEYTNSYVGSDGVPSYYGNNKYTPYELISANNIENVYFIDSYAKTYATEDRARLLEYVIKTSSIIPDYMRSSHIIAKLKLYNEWIELSFGIEDTGFIDEYIERLEKKK